MNDDKVEDRFHNNNLTCGLHPLKEGFEAKTFPTPKVKVGPVEFCPEPIHMSEAAKKGYTKKFTVGKQYTVLDRVEVKGGSHGMAADYCYKLQDNNGKETVVSEKFFIPAEQKLTFDNAKEPWEIGKVAEAFKACDQIAAANQETIKKTGAPMSDKALEQAAKQAGVNYKLTEEKSFDEVKAKFEKYVAESEAKPKATPLGTFDKGNALLNDMDKLMSNLGKVFPEYATADPDDILADVKKMFPNRKIHWGLKGERYLFVDGAKTMIHYDHAKKAFDGLKDLTNQRTANRMVSKLICRKLKKLF